MNYCKKYKHFIIGFQNIHFDELLMIKCNVNDKTFIKEKLTHVDEVKNVDLEYDFGNCLLFIDVENKQCSKSIKYPYLISELDGNYITSTKVHDNIYTFHSFTEMYQTAIFIFNGNNFNNNDFHLNDNAVMSAYCENDGKYQYHNNFLSLHDKEIVDSCYFDNENILINIDGDEDNKICLFNIYNYTIKELFITERFKDIKIYNNYLFGLTWYNNLNIHNLENGNLIKLIENNEIKICRFWDFYNNDLIIMFDDHNENKNIQSHKIENLLK